MILFSKRLQSIDVFRAVTMFFMIFVNDVDGVFNIPAWIKHVDENADGLGFADTIFPAFLFIVGLSIPFALSKRMQSGKSKLNIATHVAMRSLALIIMGFFHVNLEHYSHTALLPRPVFEILVTLAFFLIWLDYKPALNKTTQYILQATGIIILVSMAIIYKGKSDDAIVGMRHYWWGILGLIGWGYLTCALWYLISGGKFWWQVIALLFFLCFNVIMHTQPEDLFSSFRGYYIWPVGNGSMAGFIMAGIVTSLIYTYREQKNVTAFIVRMILIAIAFIVFGFIMRPIAGGISKDHDTPAWVGICIGISIFVFMLLIYLVDIKNKAKWFAIIKPAGTSTLTCYLIPYLLYSLMDVCYFKYPHFLSQGTGGMLRSFAVAFIVIFVAGFLEKKHLRLKI